MQDETFERRGWRSLPVKKAIGDVAGIGIIAAALFAVAQYTPEKTVNGGMFIFFFVMLAVMGVFFWHRESPPQSSNEWARALASNLLIFAIVLVVGIGFAYKMGIRGSAIEMISSNGTLLILVIFCPAVLLIAAGGLLRAIILETLSDPKLRK